MANPQGISNAGTRHKWTSPSLRGGKTVTCYACGCKKTKRRAAGSNSFEIIYQMPDAAPVAERPACPHTAK